MMASSHIVFGIGAWAVTANLIGVEAPSIPYLVGLGAAGFGALLPDFDTPKSKIGRLLPGVSHLMFATFGHRTITHSWLAILLIGVAGWSCMSMPWMRSIGADISSSLLIGLCAGYVSHIVADLLTSEGVAFFWPSRSRLFVPLVSGHTGGVREYFISMSVAFAAVVVFYISSQGMPLSYLADLVELHLRAGIGRPLA